MIDPNQWLHGQVNEFCEQSYIVTKDSVPYKIKAKMPFSSRECLVARKL